MATFGASDTQSSFTFHFINHSNTPIRYDFTAVTNGENRDNGNVAGATVDSKPFELLGRATLEQGNVPVITISGVPSPGFRFWSGMNGLYKNQYINALAGNGYEVTNVTDRLSWLPISPLSATSVKNLLPICSDSRMK